MIIQFLTKRFISDSENTKAMSVRTAYGVFGGILGVVCNLILFVLKILIGSAMHSIAIVSDAFNNLSDIGSSVVTFIGAKLSSHRPDKEHPFGHGRIEYVCSLIVSFIIITVGFELIKSSFIKILHPVAPILNPIMLLILALSVLVKLWMFFAMRFLGNKIDSDVLRATSADNLNDVFATSAVILSVVLCSFLPPIVDGIAGMVVAFLICITGIRLAWSTVNTLLGASPDPALAKAITEIMVSYEEILGIHDLIIHDYGPGRTLASVHAEVSSESTIIQIHEVIDALENKILETTGVETVIHTDPILVGCEKTERTKCMVLSVVSDICPELGIHDFRMTDGENKVNLIFDLECPFSMTEETRNEICRQIEKRMKEVNPIYSTIIRIDNKLQY